jgi:putative membrane protein
MKEILRKTAQQAQEDTARVVERVFTAPSSLMLILPILFVSFLWGLILEGFSWNAVVSGFVVFAIPAFLAALITLPIALALKGTMFARRSTLLAFLSLLIMGPSIILWRVIFTVNPYVGSETKTALVLFAFATVVWLRHVTLVATSNSNHLRSLPSSLTQPVIGMIIAGWFLGFVMRDVYLSLLFLFVFAFAALIFIRMMNTPLRKSFGVNGVAMMKHLLDHITMREKDDVGEVEEFFEAISSPIDAHVGIASFKKGGEIKALIVVPSVHPGPFGYLGGSNLPAKLMSDLRKVTPNLFVPHGPSTHDYNPSSRNECKKISFMVRNLLHDVEYSSKSSALVRRTLGDANVCAQFFGDSAFIVGSLAPKPTDDLDFSTGYACLKEAGRLGGGDCLFVDAHNCLVKGSGHVHFGTRNSRYLIETSGKVVEQASETKSKGLKVGVADATGFSLDDDGLGEMGIQALVVETGGQRYGYLLYDGNNMVSGLREKILQKIGGLLHEAEVLTTDNHSVNATMGGFNPVGGKMDHEKIAEISEGLVKKAIEDLEDVKAGTKTGTIHDFNIFGHQSAARLTSVINSTLSSLRWNTFASILVALSLSALVFLVFFY